MIDEETEGIFVPFKEYKSLYQKAKEAFFKKENETDKERYGPSVTQAVYQGSIKGNLISFTAKYQIVQKQKEPVLLLLPLKGVLFRKASLSGEIVHLYYKDQSPRLIIPGAGSYDLFVEFDVPINFKEKKGVVNFDIPPVSVGEVKILSDFSYELFLKDLLLWL